ncbi:MAG: hypothetical protein DWQ07_13065 [Chloroflexi bacterium]|nr:MAG: hypothetical protein DWQ07_13065 [Chloroflexota bacterium]MBL1196971.1 hypothetical protein [Chloroflexota bacterium]NOH14267.1 hypothetical protein [Chloroflexota bacterium]
MVQKERVWDEFDVIMFSLLSFALGLGIAVFFTPMLVEFLLRDISQSEFEAMGGDMAHANFSIGYFLGLFPMVAGISGLLIYTTTYLYLRRGNDLSRLRGCWLLYPVITITFIILFYLAQFLAPLFY